MKLQFPIIIGLLLAILILGTSGSAIAQSFDSGWVKLTKAQFDDFQLDHNGIRINNLSINEDTSFMYGDLHVLKFQAAVRNNTTDEKHFSIQLIGMKEDGSPIFVASSEPEFGGVKNGSTQRVENSFVINDGAVQKTTKFVIRIIGDF